MKTIGKGIFNIAVFTVKAWVLCILAGATYDLVLKRQTDRAMGTVKNMFV